MAHISTAVSLPHSRRRRQKRRGRRGLAEGFKRVHRQSLRLGPLGDRRPHIGRKRVLETVLRVHQLALRVAHSTYAHAARDSQGAGAIRTATIGALRRSTNQTGVQPERMDAQGHVVNEDGYFDSLASHFQIFLGPRPKITGSCVRRYYTKSIVSLSII